MPRQTSYRPRSSPEVTALVLDRCTARRQHRSRSLQQAVLAGGWGARALEAAWDRHMPSWRTDLELVNHRGGGPLDPEQRGRLDQLKVNLAAYGRFLARPWARLMARYWRSASSAASALA